MSMVLRTKAMEAFGQLCWQMDIQRATTAEDLHGCIGAVQRTPRTGSGPSEVPE